MLWVVKVPEHIFVIAYADVLCTAGRSDASLENDLSTFIERGGIGVTEPSNRGSGDDTKVAAWAVAGWLAASFGCGVLHDIING